MRRRLTEASATCSVLWAQGEESSWRGSAKQPGGHRGGKMCRELRGEPQPVEGGESRRGNRMEGANTS